MHLEDTVLKSAVGLPDDIIGCDRGRLHLTQITKGSDPVTLPHHPDCTECDLFEGCKTVGMASRPYRISGKKRALLVIGEAPGAVEDETGHPFVGDSGKLLTWVYLSSGEIRHALSDLCFRDHVDIYLDNAVRCRPVQNATPKPSHRKACRPHLSTDIQMLQAYYEEVVILCVGATATQTVLGLNLTAALKSQGTSSSPKTLPDVTPCRVFSTFHPAMLMRKRNPALADSILEHLRSLSSYLRGDKTYMVPPDFEQPVMNAPTPTRAPSPGSALALDIETYGAVANMPPQNYFHPEKCMTHDKIPRDQLIRTIALSYEDGDKGYRNVIFKANNRAHMKTFWSWIAWAREYNTPLLGMNLKFDLLMLRAAFPLTGKRLLNHEMPVEDIGVYNFLHNELRPEKSLKDLSALFNVTQYTQTLRDHRFKDDDDPGLHRYNTEDCLASLKLRDYLTTRIQQDYGLNTQKLSTYSMKWFSDLIWLAVYMSEWGVAMDTKQLEALEFEHRQGLFNESSLFLFYEAAWVYGKGSKKAIQQLFDRGVDSLPNVKFELTETRKDISTSKGNMNLLLEHLPDGPIKNSLECVSRFRKHQKLITTYLGPLLVGRGKKQQDKGVCHINNIVFPDWFPFPGTVRDDAGVSGGTIQCRMTCKRPALQTAPPSIKACITTRYTPGSLLVADLSQIELRVAALLSGDLMLMRAYQEKRDIHTETAKVLFGEDIVNHKDFKDVYRQGGKVSNFLMIFRGGWEQLQRSMMVETGVLLPNAKCREICGATRARYAGLYDWQEAQIQSAIDNQYIEVPLSGASRLFVGDARTIRATYTNAICNLPIQSIAAKIMISAQKQIVWHILQNKLRAASGLQIYDSVFVECATRHEEELEDVMKKSLVAPPFYLDMCHETGNNVPLEADISVYRRIGKTLTKIREYKVS